MEAAALSNYQLGDLLGRGASGNVYRALNFLTGETVAIKSISLLSLPPSSLPDIMSEIDLLKNLNHPNVVKYKGFTQDKENLFIVLEYCENGSLQTILKKFGKFPESLVGVYICQVLEGLSYLHDQGVIHRDIKGANILTNKDGSVKLADFGVSSRAPTPDLAAVAKVDADNEVVGSPYWMAPEVIEQSGATTASDIWSVGCVVVELMEGKPPYGDLAPMQALWRIVQDESMRIPDGASPMVKDFLYHCFQKDANLRISAKKLLRHAWMQQARKHLSSAASPGTLPRSKASSSSRSAPPATNGARKDGHSRTGSTTQPQPTVSGVPKEPASVDKSRKPLTVYDEQVQRVQEWNEALAASPKAFASAASGTMRRIPALPNTKKAAAERRRADAAVMPPPAIASSSHAVHAPGLLQKNQHVSDVLSRARESVEQERWDDDFASDISLPKLNLRKPPDVPAEESGHEPNQETVRQLPKDAKARAADKPPPLPPKDKAKSKVEDYSLDLGFGDDELQIKLTNLKSQDKGRTRIMHPRDLTKMGSLSNVPKEMGGLPPAERTAEHRHSAPSYGQLQSKGGAPSRPMSMAAPPSPVILQSPNPGANRTPPTSRSSSLRGRKEASESNLELQKYSETDDEDYSDMFDGPLDQIVDPTSTMQSLQLTRRSNRSWQDDDDDDDADPFAEIEDDFDTADDLEANLLRDKRATLCANVTKLVNQLEGGSNDMAALRKVCDELLGLFESAGDMGLETHFVSIHGLLAVIEVLEGRLSRDVALRLLKIVNFIVAFDVDHLESFCLVGGIPVIIQFTSKKHLAEARLEASLFIQHLTRSALTLQMFISCRGLRHLVDLLDEDYSESKTLILSALEGIGSVFDLQSPTPKPDFCRMFTREHILDPLSIALLALIKDPDVDEDVPKRAVDVLLLFSQVAQADVHVRDAFATRTIMMRLLKALDLLPRKLLVTAIKAIKHLSTSPQLIEVLQNSNAMEVLVDLLSKSLKGSYSNEISSHIFQTIYSMCRLSKARLGEAASSGIIPLLKRVINTKSPLKQFALPILCDLANAGKESRRLLWQNDGMRLYLDLLDDPYWRVSALEAILNWMQDETARVEDILLQHRSTDSLAKCFVQSSGVSFESILDPFLKILRMSSPLTSAISTTPCLRRLADALERPAKAVTKLNLLRITRAVCESHPDRQTLVSRFSLASIVDKLAKQDDAVLVRELAKEIYPSLLFGGDPAPPGDSPKGKRVISALRRTSSESGSVTPQAALSQSIGPGAVPPSLSSSTSAPRSALRIPSIMRRPTTSSLSSSHSSSRMSLMGPPADTTPLNSRSATPTATDDKPRSKRRISRSLVRDVQWEAGGENGRLRSVLPSPTRTYF
ncbi:Protein kinase of the Mitotic Exit Network [Vanrija albida]|uniref:non-specific serine/threonine protein kinase n=1 Tax=Vanrija albida TaxID=181172 RepID=A0ABR3QF17_9TREE